MSFHDLNHKINEQEILDQSLSEKSSTLNSEDLEVGIAGAILNKGPACEECTGMFEFGTYSRHAIIEATAHYLTNVVMEHFESNYPLTEQQLIETRPLFEKFNEP